MLVISERSYWRASASMDELGAAARRAPRSRPLHRLMLDAESRAARLPADRPATSTSCPTARPTRRSRTRCKRAAPALRRIAPAQAALMDAARAPGADQAVRAADLDLRCTTRASTTAGARWCRPTSAASRWTRSARCRRSCSTTRPSEVDQGRADIYDTLLLNRIGIGAMTALSLLALFMYLRQTAALERAARASSSALIQAERDQLEREVARRTAQLRRAGAPPADRTRGRTQPARPRTARRTRRPAHRRQARRGAPALAPGAARRRRCWSG